MRYGVDSHQVPTAPATYYANLKTAGRDFVGRYLDESIQLFAKEQRELRDRFKNVVGIDPLETVTQVAQKNYQRWKALQEEVFSRLPRPFGRDDRE